MQYFDRIAEKLKSKSLSAKDWWATLKTFIKPTFTSSIPPLESNGHIVTDEYEKANTFNTYFQSQTILDDSNAVLPELPPPSYHTQLNRIIITPLEVESILKTLKLGKASGPNGLNNRVLKELSKELSSPLCSLFNQSLNCGVLPASYKIAHVSPIPKKGDLSVTSNHRPISLLNAEGKVFERLVFKHLFNHLQNNNILSSLQSGFFLCVFISIMLVLLVDCHINHVSKTIVSRTKSLSNIHRITIHVCQGEELNKLCFRSDSFLQSPIYPYVLKCFMYFLE